VFQFAVSIILIAGTITFYKQLSFIKERDLGYDKEHVLVIPLRDNSILNKSETLRAELLKVSRVSNVSYISDLPEGSFSTRSYYFEGQPEDDKTNIPTYMVGDDFIQTMRIDLVQGEDFNAFTEKKNLVLVNEHLVKKFNLESPMGKKIYYGEDHFRIIGIVKDFNFMSLRENIEPLILHYRPSRTSYALIRITPGDHKETIAGIEETWAEIFPSFPLDKFFLDDRLNDMYQSEDKMLTLNSVLSVIAVFIACLGLFALASHIIQRRRKEIGVRKVLGASVTNIAAMVSMEFIGLVGVAFIVAVPLAYYLISMWLERYVFRIETDIWLFLIPGLIILLVSLLTVSTQAIKAATSNPVKSIRYE
jgi:putative ABC transport system permease protein